MTKVKWTQIGTDTKPIILGKKRRSPNINSQAYRDNFDNIFGKKERQWKKGTLKDDLQPYLLAMI